MSHESHNPKSDEWRDRLVDRGLEELLSGDVPPDLSEKILAAAGAADDPTSVHISRSGDLTMATATATQKFGVRGWVLAASLLINCGLLAALAIPSLSRSYVSTAKEAAKLERLGPAPVGTSDESEQTDFDELIEMVEETAKSDAWKSEGGEQEPFPSNLSLEVTQSQQVHDESYDAADPKQVTTNLYDIVEGVQELSDGSSDGGQVSEELRRMNLNSVGSKDHSLPSPWYLQDDVQYHPPSPDFKLSREAAQLGSQGEGQQGVNQANESGQAPQPAVADYPQFTNDLDIPFRQNSFGLAVPEFGERQQGAGDRYDFERTVEAPVVEDGLREAEPYAPMFAYVDPARARARGQWGFQSTEWRRWPGDGRGEWPEQDEFSTVRGFDARAEKAFRFRAPNSELREQEAFIASSPEVQRNQQELLALNASYRDALKRAQGKTTREVRRIRKALVSVQERDRDLRLRLREEWQGSPDGEGIGPGASGDKYDRIHENPFAPAIGEEAISTFSIDVDTASYANIRQMLMNGHVPPPDAVRIEELVNYFEYGYDGPEGAALTPGTSPEGESEEEVPFAAHVETAGCPWRPAHRLVRIGIKGRELEAEKRPLSNLVFLVDVSGSMNNPDKLPLVKHGLKKLAANLGENDRVAVVVYASQEGLALPSTPGTEQETILAALDGLQSGGSTAGGAGIRLAYQIAEDNFIEGGTNRVILCTDGDFNVGTTSTGELERLVEKKAKDTKVFLSCIGFGRGNLNDAMMEKITGIGNGNYYYADGEREAERIFVKGMTGMLVTIAKDVKIQVEFNPAKVAGYRLLGYENRMLETQDFNDDKKDAGEIGAGHTVTCLYEIVPAGELVDAPEADPLKYQRPAGLTDAADTGEILTLKMRYKQPDEDTSTKLEWPISDDGQAFGSASRDFQFAASVASMGMLLRDSKYKGDSNYEAVLEIAQSAQGPDPEGERAEFLELVAAAKRLKPVATEEAEAPASDE